MSDSHYLTCQDDNCEKAACVDRRVKDAEIARLREDMDYYKGLPRRIALSLCKKCGQCDGQKDDTSCWIKHVCFYNYERI